MRKAVITVAVCEGCDCPISEPQERDVQGVRIVGNIYVAAATNPPTGGLIGRTVQNGHDVSDVAYCWTCFLKALGWNSPYMSYVDAMEIMTKVFPVPASTK